MWSSCEKCQEIVKMKWVEECNRKQGNVVELFKETTKNSMAFVELRGVRWKRKEVEEADQGVERHKSKNMITMRMKAKSKCLKRGLIIC